MTDVLYVGDRAIRTDTIPTLLKRYELLPKFIEELAIDEAIEEYDCTAEEKQQALLEICQRYKLTNLEEQQQWMEERGLKASEVEVMATRSQRIQKFKEAKWGRKVR
ncbi:MAG: peptidylprolyl isomerase, partial [Oscillatoriales cyanobacterium]